MWGQVPLRGCRRGSRPLQPGGSPLAVGGTQRPPDRLKQAREASPAQVLTSVKAYSRRWSSNPSGKCSYERPTRGTVCGTVSSMCGADAGYSAIDYQSLSRSLQHAGGVNYDLFHSHHAPLEARKCRNLHVVLRTCLFKRRFCTSHGRDLVRNPHNYETGTFMKERVLKIPGLLTSVGIPEVASGS